MMYAFRTVTGLLALMVCACATTGPRPARSEPHDPSHLIQRDDHGNHLGCSWYCGSPPIRVSATSTFRDGIYSYAPENAHDSKKNTVWVEGAEGFGIGERIVFSFDMSGRNDPEEEGYELGIDRVSIINGFARTIELWKANSRVKALKVVFNGKQLGTIALEDTAEPRWLDLPKMVFTPGRVH